MKSSSNRIRTSHVGRLPPPAGWEGRPEQVEAAVAATVRRQVEIGVDCVGDGEYWNGRGYTEYDRMLSGLTTRAVKPGEVGATRESTRERDEFPDCYGDMDRVGTLFCVPGERPIPRASRKTVITAPLARKDGNELMMREVAAFKAACAKSKPAPEEGFICVLAPGWLDHFIFNEFYKTDEEFVFALAEALRPEYRAVVEAGFILQLDDPGIATSWDMIKPEPSLAEYRRYTKIRIDALNHALQGLPEASVRYHFCWGSWHGPHTHDIPLKEILDLALQVKAQTVSFEAGNVRHEHEWSVWRDVKLPAGKQIMPGVVSHATNIVEHPELIATRICRFAELVGRENVIAGTDCGLGSRVHAEIAWAKLAALVEGARLASKQLWR